MVELDKSDVSWKGNSRIGFVTSLSDIGFIISPFILTRSVPNRYSGTNAWAILVGHSDCWLANEWADFSAAPRTHELLPLLDQRCKEVLKFIKGSSCSCGCNEYKLKQCIILFMVICSSSKLRNFRLYDPILFEVNSYKLQ